MATLSILDMKHHKVIHGMVWQVESDRFESYKESDVGKFKRGFPTMSIIMLFFVLFSLFDNVFNTVVAYYIKTGEKRTSEQKP